ncbi:MAG TPA: DUF4861 family protein [Gemmatimonadaceae bacterium]|nr:DUF4861 family protein [Gemmatimonadaceae bacterium]
MLPSLAPALLAALALGRAGVPGPLTVSAVNPLSIARASQTIALTREQLAPLGEQDLNRIHVIDAAGRRLIVQAVDTDYDAYHRPDVLIFQSDFGPRERKRFTVTAGAPQRLQPSDYRAYGRFVRERFDDFAWENDLIAHRTYGSALETWKGEPLTSSAIDIWSKLRPKLIIDEWYMMGDRFYHDMSDNGGDDYTAGPSRGDGGNGVWAADRLWVSHNFVSSRELANGPIRVMFELDYAPFDAGGRRVSQVVRVTLDAGSQLDHYQVKYRPEGAGGPLTGAVGLKKVGQEQEQFDAANGTLAIWEAMEKNRGMQGLAAIVDPKLLVRRADDASNHLLLVNARTDSVMDYWAGFAWDRAGRITSASAWQRYVADFARGLASPIEVTVSAE